MAPEPLLPGATLGILGGGQLGRMLAIAAARLGLHVHVYARPSTTATRSPALPPGAT
jgi:5-(carboxyamino)imidazole ribonucleotide synthase